MGSWWPARICQHASPSLQWCRCHPLHVWPDPKEHSQFNQGMVSPRSRFQQDSHSLLSRHQIWPLREFPKRGARGNIYTGTPMHFGISVHLLMINIYRLAASQRQCEQAWSSAAQATVSTCKRYVICSKQPIVQNLTHLPDLQNRPLKSLRSQVYHSRDRKHGRTSPNLPACGGVAALKRPVWEVGMRHGRHGNGWNFTF